MSIKNWKITVQLSPAGQKLMTLQTLDDAGKLTYHRVAPNTDKTPAEFVGEAMAEAVQISEARAEVENAKRQARKIS
jgi:hypothetical protein